MTTNSISIQLLSRICQKGLKEVIWKNSVHTQVNRAEADHAPELAPHLSALDLLLKTLLPETIAKKEQFSGVFFKMYINNTTTQHSRC